jgi:hypothetical protein
MVRSILSEAVFALAFDIEHPGGRDLPLNVDLL